jgi:lipopolysaccharide export system protein LptA
MKKTFILLFTLMTLNAEELKVVSDNFRGDQPNGVSIFTGHVIVTKGQDELNASKVTIYTDAGRKPTKYVAEGDVSFYIVTENNEKYKGKSQKAIYLPKESEYQFYTKVDLIRLDDYRRVKGDRVVVNETRGFGNADSSKDEPVVMIFTMEDKKATKKSPQK